MNNIQIDDFDLISGQRDGQTFYPDENGEICFSASLPPNWNEFTYALTTLKIIGDYRANIRLGFAPSGSTTPIMNMHYVALQNCRVVVPFPIDSTSLQMNSYFLPSRPGVFKGVMKGRTITPDEIKNVIIQIAGKQIKSVDFEKLELANVWHPEDVDGEPMVDEFGQRIRGSWQGKTTSFEELSSYLHAQLSRAEKAVGYPADWSEWGGWTKKKFTKTGWFHFEHDDKRAWLVDPDGNAFFSNGMCYGHRAGIYSVADHLDSLFEYLPANEGIMSEAWITGDKIPQYVVRTGAEYAKERKLFNFARANMIRVFGDKWYDAWITINSARLHSMGINTIGIGVNDYDTETTMDFVHKAKIPYVVTLKLFPLTEQRIFRDFPDVFSKEYQTLSDELSAKQLTPYRDDPYMIGYFVTNEPEWCFYKNINLCDRLLRINGCAASKQALIDYLQSKYTLISNLNRAWQTDFESFNSLMLPFTPDNMTPDMEEDCDAFHRILLQKYYSVVSGSLRRVDSNHLNLGMRFSALNSEKADKILYPNMNCFDAFSFNRYDASPVDSAQILAEYSDLPCLVGEWHFGAADSGLDSWGVRYADTQQLRAQAISYYLEQSTTARNLVGVHYFEYSDQPFVGRFDGESFNIGIIDVCSRPYPLVMKAFEDFAANMYPMLEGVVKPQTKPVAIKRNIE